MFDIKNVIYGDILNIPDLVIPEGKITCILGESGSGKTTLLKLLNQLISHDNGSILFGNEPIEKLDNVVLRRQVVMLPQKPIIAPGTISDNLNLGLSLAEKPLATEDQLLWSLNFVKLNKNLQDYADNLSSGEKQRVALARIILMDPKVFLLDEPSSALDEDLEELIITRMIDYCSKCKKTVIMVTHSRKIGQSLADKLITMKTGSLTSIENLSQGRE